MGGGHSSPAYIPQKILYNPVVINKSSNPSSFIYKEGFFGYNKGRVKKEVLLILLLLLFLLLLFPLIPKMKNI